MGEYIDIGIQTPVLPLTIIVSSIVLGIFASYFIALILMVGSFYRLFRVSKRKSKQISYK